VERRADIHLQMSWLVAVRAAGLLALVGLLSGLPPALRYE